MDILDTIKKNSEGKGTDTMWKTVEMLSEELKGMLTEEAYSKLREEIYYILCGGHFDEDSAKETINKMSVPIGAPIWSTEEILTAFADYKEEIPECYSKWDWLVTVRMVISDYWHLLHQWWQDADKEAISKKIYELSATYLADEDAPSGTEKVWKYFHCD